MKTQQMPAGPVPTERADLNGKFVFLSASLPDAPAPGTDPSGTSNAEVTRAVVSVARGILESNGGIVFGGHPTITPLLLSVAHEVFGGAGGIGGGSVPWEPAQGPRLIAYQSRLFDLIRPREVAELTAVQAGLAQIVETEVADGEVPPRTPQEIRPQATKGSLAIMRSRMISEFHPVAAIYIGGKQGIVDEHRAASEVIPWHYPIAAPGGATAAVLAKESHRLTESLRKDLESSRNYPLLAAAIVEDILHRTR